jgi:regulator of replication initiation timing
VLAALDAAIAEIAELRREADAALDNREKEIAELRRANERLKESRDGLLAEYDAAKEENAELRRELADIKAEIVEHVHDGGDFDFVVAIIDIRHWRSELASWEKCKQQIQQKPEQLREFIAELRRERDYLVRATDNLREESTGLRKRLAERPGLTVERVKTALAVAHKRTGNAHYCVFYDRDDAGIGEDFGNEDGSTKHLEVRTLAELAAWCDSILVEPPKVRTRRFTATHKATGEPCEGAMFPNESITVYRGGDTWTYCSAKYVKTFQDQHSNIQWLDGGDADG